MDLLYYNLYSSVNTTYRCPGLFRFRLFVHFQRKVGAGMPLLRWWIGDVLSRLSEN